MTCHFIGRLTAGVFLGICSLVLLWCPSVTGETDPKGGGEEILAIGSGRIVDGNVARAKEEALAHALGKGVEAYLTRRLGAQGMINNFPVLIHELVPKARDMIENFLILTEEQADKEVTVLVRVKVNDKLMEERFREIGLYQMEGPALRVLFLVSHRDSREADPLYWWKDPERPAAMTPSEIMVQRIFEERGFRPVNRMLNMTAENVTEEMKALDLTEEDAAKWGALYSADLVIYGECEILQGSSVYLRLSALDVPRGVLVIRDSHVESLDEGGAPGESVTTVMERAFSRVVTRMSPHILRASGSGETTVDRLEVILEGLKNFKQFRLFSEFLEKDVKGVRSLRQTRVKGRSITLSVEFSGDRESFLERVTTSENLPFPLDPVEGGEGEIRFHIR